MADKKISQLTAATTPLAGTEVLPIVQGGSTVKVSVSDLTAGRAVSVLSATLSGGTVNGVLYLNASKVATSGSALVFDGTNLGIGTASPITKLDVRSDAAVVTTSGYSSLHFNALPASATARAATIKKNYDSPFDFNIYASTGTSGNTAATIFYRDITNEAMRITGDGNIVAGASAALATTATNGFLYVPTCAGTPTGTPTAITGMAPIVVNTTNNKLYFYSGGAWRDAGP